MPRWEGTGIDDRLENIGDWFVKLSFPIQPRLHPVRSDRLAVTLIDGAESIVVDQDGSEIKIQAGTSSAGPGYHLWLCQILRQLGQEFEIQWQPSHPETYDETGYWERGQQEDIEREMRAWLMALAKTVVGRASGVRNLDGLAICMPLESAYTRSEGIKTPLGPRDVAWFERVAETGDGSDFWSWPEFGFEASFFVGQAKSLMSLQVRWRPPLDEEERQLLLRADRYLTAAKEADASIAVPVREWVELRKHLGLKDISLLEAKAQGEEGPLLGYHRYPFRYSVGPWSIQLEGQFQTRWRDNGGCEAFDAKAWIGIRSLTSNDPPGTPVTKKPEGEPVPLPDPRLQGFAVLRRTSDEQDGEGWLLSAVMQSGQQLLIVTIACGINVDRQWILDTFATVKFKG